MYSDAQVLIKIYYGDNQLTIDSRQYNRMKGYLQREVSYNLLEEKVTTFSLTPAGRKLAKMLLRCAGRDTGPKRGFAQEQRLWLSPKSHNFSIDEMIDAFETIFKSYCEVFEDWQEGRKRVIIRDPDRPISIFSSEIKWELNKSQEYLEALDLSNATICLWLWIDEHRIQLRDQVFDVEFILWDTSAK